MAFQRGGFSTADQCHQSDQRPQRTICRAWGVGTQIGLISQIYTDIRDGLPAGRVQYSRSVSSVRSASSAYYLPCVGSWNTDWTDLRRFTLIPGRAFQRGGSRGADQCHQSDQRHQRTICRAWGVGTQIGLISQICTNSREGPPAGRAQLSRSASTVRSASSVYLRLLCVGSWNTDWADCADFHRFRAEA